MDALSYISGSSSLVFLLLFVSSPVSKIGRQVVTGGYCNKNFEIKVLAYYFRRHQCFV